VHKLVTTDNAFIDARLNYETVKFHSKIKAFEKLQHLVGSTSIIRSLHMYYCLLGNIILFISQKGHQKLNTVIKCA